jgi:lysophospholipase L1-like esterase
MRHLRRYRSLCINRAAFIDSAFMHRFARICLTLLLLLPCSASPSPKTVLAATPLSRMDLSWWRERFEAKQQALRTHKVDLLFLGDSITQDYEISGPPAWRDFVPVWQHYYGDRDAVNLGFNGDATSHLLWRIENGETDGIRPKVAVILIGANNLGRLHWAPEDTVTGIEAIVAQLRHRLPDTKLLLLGVLPSDRSEWASRATIEINRALAARYQHSSEVTYIDVGPVFMKNGSVDRDLFLDPQLTPPAAPLHPTAEAQARMAATIEPALAALLGDRPHVPPSASSPR